MTPRTAIQAAVRRLTISGVPDPTWDAAHLLSDILQRPALELRLDTDTLLTPLQEEAYEALICRREKREPLQYIEGETDFCGHVFSVTHDVLIPRPETEMLVAHAVHSAPNAACVLDVCCGSGCIGLSVKFARPDLQVVLSDISPEALAVARRNAARLSCDVTLTQGDLLTPFAAGHFALILANPPYIPSGECDHLQSEVMQEPRLALDGGADGLQVYRRLVQSAVTVLTPGGELVLELGDGEADSVSALAREAGFRNISVFPDFQGIARMLVCRR